MTFSRVLLLVTIALGISVLSTAAALAVTSHYIRLAVVAPVGTWAIGANSAPHSVTEERHVTILRKANPYRFEISTSTADQPFWIDVCRDFAPPDFDEGLILTRLIYVVEQDNDRCWSLNPDNHAGYFKLRDNNGRPIHTSSINVNSTGSSE